MRGGVWKNCGSWHPVGLVESLIQRRLRSYSLTLSGLENLELMRGGPCIIAANHVQPENRVLEASGFGPDSFVIQDVVRRMGWRLRIVAKYELDEWQANTIPRFLHPWAECLQRKLILMHGDIPVRRNSVRNKTFLRMITRAISNKDAILWYPTGVWAQDFSLDQEVRPGVAYVAKRFGVPVVPAYLRGCTSWRACQKVDVVFGEAIHCRELSRQEVRARVQREILGCRQRLALSELSPRVAGSPIRETIIDAPLSELEC
jgi:1-acyl-sn-glycerol-3-phosphate acyltransferase